MPRISSIDLRSIRIQRNLKESIFSQLYRQLRELILSGGLPIKSRLPSTRVLTSEIGVSRITVREAYEQLVAEGFLTSSAGKGTFVSQQPGLQEAISFDRKKNVTSTVKSDIVSESTLSKRAELFLSIPLSSVELNSLPFNPSVPDISLFPLTKWNSVVKKSMLAHRHESMHYGEPAGFPALREYWRTI